MHRTEKGNILSKPAERDRTPDTPDWLRQDFRHDEKRNVWVPNASTGDFGYSDGDAHEDYLLSVVRNAKSCDVMSDELSKAMKDWPSTYHLHHQRCNLLRPFTDLIRGPVLEIGAGCGAITRFLGQQNETVVALEGSTRRASIVGARCRDQSNVWVLNTNFSNLRTGIKFQTITLIGVLEYARLYFEGGGDDDPVDQMLRRITDMLTDDGVLLIAIENQLGLKYFAGFAEDHLGIPMSGIEEHYDASSIVTFGRHELSQRILEAGLTEWKFAYPFPDYKFPEAILSDEAMTGPHAESYAGLIAGSLVSDRQRPDRLNFRMTKAIKPVMRNGIGPDLANSFLVMCSRSTDALARPGASEASYYGNGDRKKPYLKAVSFKTKDGKLSVTRRSLTDTAAPDTAGFVQVLEDEDFVDGTLWSSRLQDILVRKNWTIDDIENWARVWLDVLEEKARIAGIDATTELEGRWLDAIPKNMILDDSGKGHFIDLEWHAKVPQALGYILVRGLADSLAGVESAARSKHATDIASMITDLCGRLGAPMERGEVQAYLGREDAFQKEVSEIPKVGTKLRFVRSHLSKPVIDRLDLMARRARQLGYMIRHPKFALGGKGRTAGDR